jgi:hypothetical protein
LFIGVCSLGDGGVDPLFESHHVFVTGGQESRGDEDAAQVLDCLPGGQLGNRKLRALQAQHIRAC